MVNLSPVHVYQAVRHRLEDLHELRQLDARADVERLAVDVLNEQVRLADAEEPVADGLERVNFYQVGMVQELRDAELVLGLFEELPVTRLVDRHNLQSVVLAVRAAANVQDAGVGTGPELTDD